MLPSCVGNAKRRGSSAAHCASRTSLFPGWTPVRDFALVCDASWNSAPPQRFAPGQHRGPGRMTVQAPWACTAMRPARLDASVSLPRCCPGPRPGGAGLRPQQTSPRGRGHALGPCLRLSAPPLRLTCWGRCCSQGCVLNALAPPQGGGSPGDISCQT